MAKIKATHRLRAPHYVRYDPDRHFVKGDEPAKGDKVKLPAGAHLIPTENELQNIGDRLEPLSTPEAPEEKDEDELTADEQVDAALEAAGGSWEALTSEQLQELAAAYEIDEDSIEGSGSSGNILKADWLEAVQDAYGA